MIKTLPIQDVKVIKNINACVYLNVIGLQYLQFQGHVYFKVIKLMCYYFDSILCIFYIIKSL